tara:strand:- start:19 stop:1149 length:1131 start_codon:yes stop_codon:yes gene_type:complete
MAMRRTIKKGNKYIHEYPLGMYTGSNDDTKYRASLTFIPVKVSGQTISKFAGTDLSIFNSGEKLVDTVKGFAEKGLDFIGLAPDDPDILKKTEDYNQMITNHRNKEIKSIEPLTYDDDFGVEQKQRACLYMPMTVQQMENVSVGPESLGVIGGSISTVIAGGNATLTGLATKAFEAGIGGALDFVSGNAGGALGSLMANKIASRLNTQAGLGVQNATRIQISPNTRAIFKQVNIREWNFSFQLIPTSERESEEIENIIDFFRMEQLPEELGANGISMAYKFPNLIRIYAQYDKIDEDGNYEDTIPIITRFLPAYLQSVDVTYNTSGMSFYDNGKFHDATLNVKFIEYRPLNKGDIIRERNYMNRSNIVPRFGGGGR